MKTLVIGAHGQIGFQLCTLAADAGLPVRAMIRDPGQRGSFEKIGVESVVADLEEDFSFAFDGCDQVIFTAGSGPHTGPDKTLLVDLYGAVRAIELAEDLGIGRLIMVSAMRADRPMDAPEKLRPYMAAKYAADVFLRRSRLEYVSLKPGRLTDDPASGCITTDPEAVSHNTISRGNVAQVLLAVAANRALRHREHPLLDGEEPVETVFS